MPKTPIDYSKTVIYKLVHKEDYDNVNVYIGSTTDFMRRKSEHKSCCNNENRKGYTEKKYQYIRDNGGWNEWLMIEIEKHNCNDGNEARAREEYWRCHFHAKLNANRAYITEEQKKEYKEQNRGKLLENNKEHYKKNKDNILEKITCDCGCIIIQGGLSRHRKSKKHLMKIGVLKYEFIDDNDEN